MPGANRGHYYDSLKTQRVAAGLSLNELARRANVSVPILVMAEGGTDGRGNNLELGEAQRVADVLGVSLATLGQRMP